jgi:hypothetical protein
VNEQQLIIHFILDVLPADEGFEPGIAQDCFQSTCLVFLSKHAVVQNILFSTMPQDHLLLDSASSALAMLQGRVSQLMAIGQNRPLKYLKPLD